jgi:hypothetical protein
MSDNAFAYSNLAENGNLFALDFGDEVAREWGVDCHQFQTSPNFVLLFCNYGLLISVIYLEINPIKISKLDKFHDDNRPYPPDYTFQASIVAGSDQTTNV